MAGPTAPRSLSDAELAIAARTGDAAALAVLLERHKPRLFATALRQLGYRADAEDAVQETCLIALRYVGGVRDPDAIAGWLFTVLRRVCLQHRRSRREVLTEVLPEAPDDRETPEDRIERLELRDWIHDALGRLPEPLRVTSMLRYFGSYDSYDEVAAILGIPIGTVRSRLSEAKVKLADALLASAGLIDDDQRKMARDRERLWTELILDIYRRGSSSGFVSQLPVDVLIAKPGGTVLQGRSHLAAEIEADLAAGVRMRPERVMTNDGIAIIEGRFVNPPEAPHHCPPGIALVFLGTGERASRVHLHLAPRPPRASDE